MWTPPQWPIAFPATAAVMVACVLAIIWGSQSGASWLVGVAGGIVAGLSLSIGWTLRPLIMPLAIFFALTALLALTAVWLATSQALPLAATVTLVIAAIWVLGYDVAFTGWISRPIERAMESVGEGDGRRALIVYHPGRSELQARLQRRLAETMAGQGWRVDLATAHRSSIVDVAGYDLLVLGAPAYNFRPARPLTDHLARLKSLEGKPVVLVVTGGGMTEAPIRFLIRRAQEKGARVTRTLELWTQRPNLERYGIDDPFEIVRRAGLDLAGGSAKGPHPPAQDRSRSTAVE
jgi:hypothetical protein